MHLTVVGTGYVGLVSAVCFAELGHTVAGVDIDERKVRTLQSGTPTIYEPGLEEVLRRTIASGLLSFTTDITEVLPKTSVVFSAVATPPNEDYTADLRAVFTVAETVARHADHDLVFVNKSTVPVGTGQDCEQRIAAILAERGAQLRVPVVSNPEFLREGSAIKDTMNPDRIIVGINGDDWATELMDDIYQPLVRTGKPLGALELVEEAAAYVPDAAEQRLVEVMRERWVIDEPVAAAQRVRDLAERHGVTEVMVSPGAGAYADEAPYRSPGRERTLELLAKELL